MNAYETPAASAASPADAAGKGVGPEGAGSGSTSSSGAGPVAVGEGGTGSALPRVLMFDPEADHQIRLFFLSGKGEIAVSCACVYRRSVPGNRYFKAASLLPADEALAIYREHLADVGAAP